jgi:hypothetical protein
MRIYFFRIAKIVICSAVQAALCVNSTQSYGADYEEVTPDSSHISHPRNSLTSISRLLLSSLAFNANLTASFQFTPKHPDPFNSRIKRPYNTQHVIAQSYCLGAINENPDFFKTIAKYFKDKIDETPHIDGKIKELLGKHYSIFKLRNINGTWGSQELESMQQRLYSGSSANHLGLFIDQMAENAAKNEYISSAMRSIPLQVVKNFCENIDNNTLDVLYLSTYALALNSITRIMITDPESAKAISTIWEENNTWFPHPNFYFIRTKYLTLKPCVFFSLLIKEFEKTSDVDQGKNPFLSKVFESLSTLPMWAGMGVNINIFEACVADFLNGYTENAYSGLLLIKNSYEQACTNPSLLKEWINMYHLWNAVFVAENLNNNALILTKLFIPIITDPDMDPATWVRVRLFSLYATGHYLMNGYETNAFKNISLHLNPGHTLLNYLGKVSAESAKKYEFLPRQLVIKAYNHSK